MAIAPRRPLGAGYFGLTRRGILLAFTTIALAGIHLVAGAAGGIPVAQATGATCSPNAVINGAYTVVSFQGAGTCTWVPPLGVVSADVLVVGGGGGGGGGPQWFNGLSSASAGGGGGGGRVVSETSLSVSGNVSITVGAGGAGGSGSTDGWSYGHGISAGAPGGDSSFGAVSALGGGRGDIGDFASEFRASGDGGNSGRQVNGVSSSTSGGTNRYDGAGGGAGAGANGSDGTDLPSLGGNGGAGGAGTSSSITGSAVVYGGGGGGAGAWNGQTGGAAAGTGGLGGSGGGGNGSQLTGSISTAGTDGLGGGGGGGGMTDGSRSAFGARGGNGVVIVRYLTRGLLVVSTPPGDKPYGGSVATPVVQIQDGYGNNLALPDVALTATLTSGSGTLSGATATTSASGTATFTGFSLDAAAGSYVVTFSATDLTSVTSAIQVASPPSVPAAPEPVVTPAPTPSPSQTPSMVPANSAPAAVVIEVPVGSSAMLVNGAPVEVQRTPVSGGGIAMSGGGLQVEAAPNGGSFSSGGGITVDAAGYAPASTVAVHLYSTPITLGTLSVDASGRVQGSVVIPPSIPPGEHTLQFAGWLPDGTSAILSTGVTVRSKPQELRRTILFDYRSSTLSPAARRAIAAVTAQVKSWSSSRTIVVGYVRAKGASASDVRLAQARAQAVLRRLRADGLTGNARIGPLAPTEETTANARKVVITISSAST